MMLAFLMYLMMQKQAIMCQMSTGPELMDAELCRDYHAAVKRAEQFCAENPHAGYCGAEPREYPAIKREQVHMMDWADCPIGFDQGSDVDGRLCTPNPRYTCKSPDTEVLEFTVSGRAFCRKVN